jgi:hypothetical protein
LPQGFEELAARPGGLAFAGRAQQADPAVSQRGLEAVATEARTAGEYLVGLAQQGSRRVNVGQGQVAPGQLDPGLDGDMRRRVGEAGPKGLRPGQFGPGPWQVALMQRRFASGPTRVRNV